MRSLWLALLCLFGPVSLLAKEKPPTTYSIPLPPKPDFGSLDWLVGEWTGKTTGSGPQGEIRFSASYDLEKRFMVFREQISLPATKTAPASREAWMGILSGSTLDSGFVLRSFSTTGFISRYRVTVDGVAIYFNPEGGEQPPPGWLFRRVIQHINPAQFSETVQASPTNKPFFDYYTAKLTRVIPSKQSSSPH